MTKVGLRLDQNCPFRWGDLDHGFLDPTESASKRHLDQFSRFCTAHPCVKHKDRRTHRLTDIQRHRPRYVRHL